MKDYYQILRVRRGASAPEIRRAYRVLVQQLHPDVNPDPTAHELIKEVNEAYDVLGDATKKQEYDYRLDNPYVTVTVPQEPVHRDRAYRPRSATRPVNRGPSQADIMKRYIHLARKISWAGFVLCSILLIDYILPHRIVTEHISTFSNSGAGRYEANYLLTESGERIKISVQDGFIFELDQPIEIVKSRLLFILVEIRVPEKNRTVNNLSTLYANFKFVPWLLMLFSVVGLVLKEAVEFRFNLGIMTFFVLMFAMFLLLK